MAQSVVTLANVTVRYDRNGSVKLGAFEQGAFLFPNREWHSHYIRHTACLSLVFMPFLFEPSFLLSISRIGSESFTSARMSARPKENDFRALRL